MKYNPYPPGRPSRRPPPPAPGAYRWINRETSVVEYIGETSNLRHRYRQHLYSKRFSTETHYFEWQRAKADATTEDRRNHERTKIKDRKPSQNRRGGGGGRKSLQSLVFSLFRLRRDEE